MTGRAVLVLGLLVLAGCADTQPSPAEMAAYMPPMPMLPEGYPAKIGAVSAVLNGTAQNWDNFDYSVGAYDASVQVLNYNGEIQFRLMGETPGKPDLEVNRLVMRAGMKSLTQTGVLAAPVIELVAGKDWEGPRLTSTGSSAHIVLDSLTPMGPQGAYGHVKGHFDAVLCAANGEPPQIDRKACQPFKGTFSSDLQIGGP